MANKLRLETRISDPDGFYEKLIDLHQGLSPKQSEIVNAKLILILANHVGDAAVLDEALLRARAE
jgi:hypothetical protein